MALPNEPITRQEMYLSNIAGQNTALPDAPITREEMYLDYIAKSGGTGEGDMKKSVYDSDNAVASAGGIKMFVNQKIGTLPQRVGSLETTAGVLEGEVASIEDTLDNLGTASTKNSTSVVTESSDLVESGAVYDALGFGNKNLFDPNSNNKEWVAQDNQIVTVGTAKTVRVNCSEGDTLTLSNDNVATSESVMLIAFLDSQNNVLLRTPKASDDNFVTATAPSNTAYAICGFYTWSRVSNAQLEKGSTATAYEPYHASINDTLRDAEVVEGKNLLPMTLKSIQNANTTGTWSGNTYVKNGITFTINTDNNGNVVDITASGTASSSTELSLLPDNTFYLPKDSYILSGGVTYNARIFYYDGTSYYNSRPDEVNFDVSGNETVARYTIVVVSGTTVNNAVFKPMIRKATETDPTYEPYYVPLKNVVPQKCDNSVIGTVEGANASKAWSVGEHFIKDGQFKEVTNAIASGEAINSGNTTDKTIADALFNKGYASSVSLDLNNIKTSGIYYISSGYTNVPENAQYCVLIVKANKSTDTPNFVSQTILKGDTIYCRAFAGSPPVWNSWYKYTGTIVS